ncbi:MAG: septum formation protein Maf [Marinilabiliales bacterium]|nr:MAG: septum formation protein Maf [Marinilabiliales bacterium]
MILNEKIKDFRVVLASASPRRHALLHGMGIDFDIAPVHAEEIYPKALQAAEVPEYLSRLKSEAYPLDKLEENDILVTADTIVWKDGRVIEKPVDEEDAVKILNNLSGNMHEVFTAVTLKSLQKQHTFSVRSAVWFRELSDEEIDYYIDTHQPFDKAGSYGVQEWIGYIAIERIEGSYFNVMGLPTQQLYKELCAFIGE